MISGVEWIAEEWYEKLVEVGICKWFGRRIAARKTRVMDFHTGEGWSNEDRKNVEDWHEWTKI